MKDYIILFSINLFFLTSEICAQTNLPDLRKSKLSQSKERLEIFKNSFSNRELDSIYNTQIQLKFAFTTNGWMSNVEYEYTKHKFSLSVLEIFHEKETKIVQEDLPRYAIGKRTPFVFGKINNLYLLQLGYGQSRIIFPNLLQGNISVGFKYKGGFMAAFEKPYYLNIINTQGSEPIIETTRYTEANSNIFLNRLNILGSSPWTKGLGQTIIKPGIFGEIALMISPVKNTILVREMTFGVNINYTITSTTIMALHRPKHFYPNCFIGLAFGKRW